EGFNAGCACLTRSGAWLGTVGDLELYAWICPLRPRVELTAFPIRVDRAHEVEVLRHRPSSIPCAWASDGAAMASGSCHSWPLSHPAARAAAGCSRASGSRPCPWPTSTSTKRLVRPDAHPN